MNRWSLRSEIFYIGFLSSEIVRLIFRRLLFFFFAICYWYFSDMIEGTDLLTARTEDLIRSVDKKAIVYTHFLSESELAVVLPIVLKSGYFHEIFGGYDDADRRVICISSYAKPEYEDFPITTLCFKTGPRTKIGHRDVLGALMSLGIKRDLVGDIIFNDKICYFFAEDTIAEYIISNFDFVANCPVSVSEYSGAVSYQRAYEEIVCNAASMRLDCVIAAVLSKSRTEAENFVSCGHVFINGTEKKKKDALLKSGDILTVRRYGKYRIDSVIGTTKKGRLKLRILKYI